MKTRLITRYYELMNGRRWLRIIDTSGFQDAELGLKMMRIDAILYERYQYDVSLTRKFNQS
jgi:hypothetical protein